MNPIHLIPLNQAVLCLDCNCIGRSNGPSCPGCGRFIKADAEIQARGDGEVIEPNATCAKCGRVAMLFEGYV